MPNAIETAIRSVVTKGIYLLADFNRVRLGWDKTPHPYLTGIHRPMSDEKTLTELAVNRAHTEVPRWPLLAHRAESDQTECCRPPLVRSETAWCTASPSRTVAQSGTAIVGSARAPSARRSESHPRRGHVTAPMTPVNTNVVGIGGRTWALVEAGAYPVELDRTFESQRYNPFDDTLAGSFTAHPHQDPKTGEYLAIAYEAY
jgi:carotenoid cleavage dioxygenase